jgi:pimeloyl-ACP methyl ester carboxylesterase
MGPGHVVSTPIIDRTDALGSTTDRIVDVPLWIPAREMIGAVVSVPSDRSSDLGVVLMSGRARDRCHKNGMWVRAAHALADRGAYVLRLDYPGVGHSSGDPHIFDLESPPAWPMEAASRFLLDETPVERLVLAGSCFGARIALSAAAGLDRVVSVAMVAPPIFVRGPSRARRLMWTAGRVLDPLRGDREAEDLTRQRFYENAPTERRVSPTFERAIRPVLARCPVYFLCGTDDIEWGELRFALDHLRLPEDRYELEVVPGVVHAFRSTEVQDLTIDRIAAWCSRFVSAAVTTP